MSGVEGFNAFLYYAPVLILFFLIKLLTDTPLWDLEQDQIKTE